MLYLSILKPHFAGICLWHGFLDLHKMLFFKQKYTLKLLPKIVFEIGCKFGHFLTSSFGPIWLAVIDLQGCKTSLSCRDRNDLFSFFLATTTTHENVKMENERCWHSGNPACRISILIWLVHTHANSAVSWSVLVSQKCCLSKGLTYCISCIQSNPMLLSTLI